MDSLIQYILDLFTNPDAARAFVSGPGQAMTDAGLVNVAPDEFSSAVANALPGLPLGVGDPIGGLQQVLADQYGYAPGYGGYDQGYGGYDQGYGGYDQGYGGYDPGYGYGPGLVVRSPRTRAPWWVTRLPRLSTAPAPSSALAARSWAT